MWRKKGRHRSSAAKHEPDPTTTLSSVAVLDLVTDDIRAGKINIAADCVAGILVDLESRSREGFKKYGTLLCTDNGRDALMDFYQEILDAIVYIRQFNAEYPDEVFSQNLYSTLWDVAAITWDEVYK